MSEDHNGSMISGDILEKVRNAVCAIGYATVPFEEFVKQDPSDAKSFVVLGTGFLVRPSTVITNRHILEALDVAHLPKGVLKERLLQFVYPQEGGWKTTFNEFKFSTRVVEKDVDVAFIEFNPLGEIQFNRCRPLQLSDNWNDIRVGRPIGMFGYPDGTSLLVNRSIDKERIYRFGPVLQQGYISAVAPYEGNQPISRILSDIRTVDGMSGSPVFYSDTGDVFAIHEDSNKTTTAFSIPLVKNEVFSWLKKHDDLLHELS